MKTNRMLAFFLLFCTLFCLWGCGEKEEENTTVSPSSTVIPEQTTLAQKDIFSVKEYTEAFNGTDGKPCCEYRYYLPYFDIYAYPQYESINQYFANLLQTATSNCRTFSANATGANGFYSESATFLVNYRDADYISFVLSVKGNDGTEETLLRRDLSTFSLADGKHIPLSHFSRNFTNDSLHFILYDTVNQCREIDADNVPTYETILQEINVYRFCLSETGIILYFDAGELLPDSQGPMLFAFDKADLTDDMELLP